MKRRSWPGFLALAFCGAALAQNALPPSVSELRQYVLRIIEAGQTVYKDLPASLDLKAQMAGLTKLIQSGQLNPVTTSIALFYRGRAATSMNEVRFKNGRKADADLARGALGDYDSVIAADIEVPSIGVTLNDALYGAGMVARTYLGDVPLAYRYWSRCAERGQAGCLNIMAQARLTGAGGTQVDLADSIELHKRVYDTGTDFSCAGAYSALAVSRTLYFGSVSPVTVDELAWLGRANALLDELTPVMQTKNPCGRVRFDVAEYLFRLSKGETQRPILERALQRATLDSEKTIASYLLGTMNEAAFRQAAAQNGSKDAACDLHFTAFWHAQIRRDAALAQAHHQAMAGLGRDFCEEPLVFAKLKYGR